jgi:hypothetical protein
MKKVFALYTLLIIAIAAYYALMEIPVWPKNKFLLADSSY